ncbi:MAG: alkaline phosphatase family protein [bacterium]
MPEFELEKIRRETDYLQWTAEPEFYRPDYDRALPGVLPTVLELLGKDTGDFANLLHVLPPAVPRRARRVLLVCLDAFGFQELAISSRFRALFADYGTWITSVFPTITSCALTSLYQGLEPARHGILGHNIWKDSPGGVVDMLRMQVVGAQAPLAASGFDLSQWSREKGIVERDSAFEGKILMPSHIVESGLSTLIYGGSNRFGFVDLLEGLTKAGRMLSDIDEGWVGLYSPAVDSLGHVVGGQTPQMALAIGQIEESLCWMAGSLPEKVAEESLLVLVADHGQSFIRERIPLHGEPAEWLAAHSKAVGHSGRVLHIYLGRHGEAGVRDALTALVGDKGRVLGFDEVKELVGPVADEGWVRQSLGDLVVALRGGYNWESKPPAPGESPYTTRLVSQHGSLTWDEMVVPLLVAPLSALPA